ncbi:MAG: class I SAM-dependent methyltransferase [Rickettsiales bacterium]
MRSKLVATGAQTGQFPAMEKPASIAEWLAALARAFAAQQCVRAALTKPTAQAGDIKSIDVRPILVKRVLKLSFTTHHRTRDVVKNYTLEESLVILAPMLREQFAAAKLYTLEADHHLSCSKAQWQLTRHAPTQTQAPALTHDRAKQHLLYSHDKPYLHALGITDAEGNVLKRSQDKFRQINKYVEILDGLLRQLPPLARLRIVDMGAGKGYLTFALYDYVTATLGITAEIIGVESRAELVQQCNAIAQQSGFTGLRFVQGSIADYDCSGADAVIALHACDTATDDAIDKAIRANASLIVVAPCCHKQVRRAMTQPSDDHPLHMLLQYGTYVERLSEMVTDAMRAQLMELAGYRTHLFEFIADAHTPKNVMIVASKSATPLSAKRKAALAASLAASKATFQITHHRLEKLLAAHGDIPT